MLASLLPALKASSPNLVADLRGEAPAGRVGARRFALRDVLVVTQVAFTAVLLVVAGLLLRSLAESQRADVGFPTRGLALISFDTDMVRYTPERGAQFWAEVLTRVRAMPGVVSAATTSPTAPFQFNFNQQELRVDNRTYAEGQRGETIENVSVSPGYVPTLGLRVLDGRDLDGTDRPGAPLVALINETMARRYWPDESAVGHTFRAVSTGNQYRVVGVVANHKMHGVLERPAPLVYFASEQRPARYNFLLARTAGDAAELLAVIRRELLSMEPGLVFLGDSTMEQNLAISLMPARVGATLADRVWGARHAAGGDRVVRGDRVLGRAPNEGDRAAPCSRRADGQRPRHGDAARLRPGRHRGGDRRRPRGRGRVYLARPALRHHPDGSAGLAGRDAHLAGRGGGRQPGPRAACDAGRSDDGVAHRIGARAPPALVSGG